VTLRYARLIAKNGIEKAAAIDESFRPGINIYKGNIVYEAVAHDLELPFTPFKV
jgi:alanine dehydrogenase